MNIKKYYIPAFIIGIFTLRLAYSLTTEFWFKDQDVLQIYLIGLKFFTTGQFPYFGPDLVYTKAQIPGALQGLLVSCGWFINAAPEAPFVVLNILLTASMGFLAWYVCKRIPTIKRWIIWIWIFIVPWSLCYFSRIINPSYVVPAAILFFIGFFEILPNLSIRIIPERLSFYLIGFALLWIYQLHMSWVLLIPFIIWTFYVKIGEKGIKKFITYFLYFFLGSITSAITVIPTFLKYGLAGQGGPSSTSVIQFHPEHLKEGLDYLIKYLSYACFDTTRFFGGDTAQRLHFLKDYWWAAPFTVFVTIFGIVQIISLLIFFFKKQNISSQWKSIKYITLAGFLLMFASSLFSVTSPGGHATVLYFPLVIIYSAHCFEFLLNKKWLNKLLVVLFISSTIMSLAISIKNYNTISLYKNRQAVVKALIEKDYHAVGYRRYELK